MPSSRRDLRIIIVDDSQGEKCSADCGTDWSSAEALSLAGQRIKDRFGREVEIEYVNLSRAAAGALDAELAREIETKNLPLPLLAINGQPRISGQFDIRQLLDSIEVEMEMGV